MRCLGGAMGDGRGGFHIRRAGAGGGVRGHARAESGTSSKATQTLSFAIAFHHFIRVSTIVCRVSRAPVAQGSQPLM